MNLTSIVNKLYFHPRRRELDRHINESELLQEHVLRYLIGRAKDTEYGRKHLFSTLKSYDDFAQNVPVNTYDDLKGYIDRMMHGEGNVLWPETVKWYAKSSGTTNDKSKFIPVSQEGLQTVHYQGGKDVLAFYLANQPDSRLFSGKGLILGGSHSPNYNLPNSLIGDLSAILIENINPLINLVRCPSKSVALLSDFEVKRDRIARDTLHQNITNLSGVPSWMLSVLVRIMELSGKRSLDEVWPNLEVFFHGGIAFTPYRQQYEQLIRKSNMNYMETYNASEGFFGIQNDPADQSMLLMLDYGVFYEFLPMDEFEKENPNIVPLSGVEIGKNYAMLITTACGLWRYEIGDTVMFTSKQPYKFLITGRTKYFINAFGEELIMDNAEKGLDAACKATGAQIADYTAAPIFMDKNAKCRHQWLIEFTTEPCSLKEFKTILDAKLQELNSDYEAKRFHDVTLQCLEIIPARKELFNDWLKSKGKLGGQHKVPRLSNHRKHMEELLLMNK
ncbi:MAG: GH3 auxin-responsive promoter family protein [Prevotella sp.]|nr:GH3 auxin-responsive promoter family protein [Prevotellaceae bacterium]MDY3936120.1 GH3 auxin-responsive promoter family protein [Prevotella sp.]MDY4217869.1 GH3 auxin-responsive promoter family protein [Prevotella sp.]